MISSLTKEQQDLIPVYLKKWLDVGYRTTTIDQTKAKDCANFLYVSILGKRLPKYYVFLDSPMQVNLVLNMLEMDKKKYSQLGIQLGSQLRSQLRSQLGSQLAIQLSGQLGNQLDSQLDSQLYSQLYNQFGIQLDSQLGSQLDSQLGSQLSSQLYSQLDSQLYNQLGSQLGSQFGSQLGSQLGIQLSSQLNSQLGSQLDSQLSSQLGSQLNSQLDSQLSSHCLEYFSETRGTWWQNYYFHYDFVLNELFPEKVAKPEFTKFNEYINHMKDIHMIYMFDDICLFSDFPKEINVNKANQLHNEKSAALLYRDGYSLFKLNGITVSEEIIKKSPEEFTKKDLTEEVNADTRREIIRKIGNERLLKLLDYKTIDTFEEYKLISFDIGDGRVRPFNIMTCPSTGLTHILGVDSLINKAGMGLAYLFNQKEYKRPIKEDGINRGGDVNSFNEGQTIFRHGDVLFKRYDGHINDIKNIQTSGVIHKGNNNNHEYASGLFEIQEVDGKRIVVVLDECIIDHNEHGKQSHPVGTYEIDIAKEYDHWLEESRKVID